MNIQPCIIGVADAPLQNKGRALPNTNVLSMQRDCAISALSNSGLKIDDIDGIATAGMWGIPGPGLMPANLLIEYLGIKNPKWIDSTNTGGSAFLLHLGHAYDAIKQGICETILISYGSMQKTEAERKLGNRPAVFSNQFEIVAGLPLPVGAYAMAANRHMYKYGSNKETLAEIAVSTRSWASLNNNAAFRDKISIEDVIKSTPIAYPLNRLDCCLVTDGGGAVIVTTEERAKDLDAKPIYVLGHGESASHSSINYMIDMAYLDVAEQSSKQSYKMSGLTAKDIDLAMIYDSFTITVLLTLEAIGICKPGEGADFLKGQRTAPGGEFPLNTNGGGLSYCHPGMYGIFTIIEAVKQLSGSCNERQVKNLTTAICHGTGGVLSSAGTVILSNEKI